ncbi:hypothetical protein VOLCADRAFT_96452 [Volvox carteri f. nagariensis]|uniref:Sugar phosphate transporter domain-containing protein n=1 Tax=Volvox carteri f. nagariensis TaxID=3068 RepID=D8UA53_VOLCA|nr:uncharacterized protein VOLCADRAFT_96452 [Volvox carteri f. nagariensis]EFJ43365.1 hypothetical protein VOLCADRAFT_96452 [Volvox carteri f. nagariensis]|eukprot:XP_002955512.1 hypothetical protein VOLCADRAFT_96452 [Volvox carteri f. nagariensis]
MAGINGQTSPYIKVFYVALNVFSACCIVFVNKLVFTAYRFRFVTTLTLVHTTFTWAGMLAFSRVNFFTAKHFSPVAVAPLALGYVGYIILNNLSLNLNTVGFYQILKIAIAPTVMLLDFILHSRTQTWRIMMSVFVVCAGVTAATVTDSVAISNVLGLFVGLTSVLVTALYQIWAGSKQKELQASSSQLLLAYTPQAIMLLLVMSPLVDDYGFAIRRPDTVLGFPYTAAAVGAIVASSLLGILVSLSTFLVIGSTSSLTYNIVGHLKTVLILAGGCLLFGDAMPWKRLAGIALTMAGIAWYTVLSVQASTASERSRGKGHEPVSPTPDRDRDRDRDPLLQKEGSGSSA